MLGKVGLESSMMVYHACWYTMYPLGKNTRRKEMIKRGDGRLITLCAITFIIGCKVSSVKIVNPVRKPENVLN